MDRKVIEQFLISSVRDGKLSRSEKSTLRSQIALEADESHERDWFRNQAFEVAAAASEIDAKQVLNWLEDVMSLLVMAERPGERSDASLAEVFFSPGESCRLRIQELLRNASSSADICVFTITDDRITDAVIDACARGIQVRVISDNDKAHDAGSDLARMKRADVPVAFDRTPDHMHNKFAVFDNQIVVSGSYNWTRSAAARNEENIVVSGDMRLVSAFQKRFQTLWEKFS